MKSNKMFLYEYIDLLQQKGRYSFTKQEALEALSCPEINLTQYINRLIKKKRVFMPRRGFLVIIPTEYRLLGDVPPSWYIDHLMLYENAPYYVGLLTAASIYGASHQKPQEFQVLSTKQFRFIRSPNSTIRFFKKKHFLSILLANEDTWIATPPSEVRNDAESVIASGAKQSRKSDIFTLFEYSCFNHYMQQAGQTITRALFEENLINKIQQDAFNNDIRPLITPDQSAKYNTPEVASRLLKEVICHLKGDAWKREEELGHVIN